MAQSFKRLNSFLCLDTDFKVSAVQALLQKISSPSHLKERYVIYCTTVVVTSSYCE